MRHMMIDKPIRGFGISSVGVLTAALLLYSLPSFAQIDARASIDSSLYGRRIVSIEIEGNLRTKSSIIRREMKLKPGDRIDPDRIEEDRKRIENLTLFNSVFIAAEPHEDGGVQLHVLVTEQWYIFPFPIFFINERDWKKLSYGAGISHLNFRGRAENLNFFFWLGYNPAVHLEYINPWIGGSRNLYLTWTAYYDRIRNKHYKDPVDESHLGFQFALGKRFGYHTYISPYLGFKSVSLENSEMDFRVEDSLPYAGILFTLDYRDLKTYPHSGAYLSFGGRLMGIPSQDTNYLRYTLDVRKYVPLFLGSTLAMRMTADLSSGSIPLYDRAYIGYQERIRGHFFTVYEGDHMALASVVFRMPVIPVRHFDLADIPQMQNLIFGISAGFFVDTGLVWNRGMKTRLSMLHSGYGLGLHLHLPYIHVLRFEIAFDENRRSQFIVDLFVNI